MSKYEVVRLEEAESQLAEIWLEASDRTEIRRAQSRLDQRLGRDPINESQAVAEGLRKLYELPLVAYFEILTHARVVEVQAIHRAN